MRTDTLDSMQRGSLAARIRRARANERKLAVKGEYAKRRTRSLAEYEFYLKGVSTSLRYAMSLKPPLIVDLGAGTGLGLSEICATGRYPDATFVGTGLIWDHSNRFEAYRLTPAELMRGFTPMSVSMFMSVFGPTHYSDHLDLMLARLDHLLMPGGLFKAALTEKIEQSEARNRDLSERNGLIGRFFSERGYGVVKKRYSHSTKTWEGSANLYLKPAASVEDAQHLANIIAANDEYGQPISARPS